MIYAATMTDQERAALRVLARAYWRERIQLWLIEADMPESVFAAPSPPEDHDRRVMWVLKHAMARLMTPAQTELDDGEEEWCGVGEWIRFARLMAVLALQDAGEGPPPDLVAFVERGDPRAPIPD